MTQNNKKIKIILSGGGTGGSVVPLLAVAQELEKNCDFSFDFLWVGTKNGPEKKMVKEAGIYFQAINSGKLRRYFSWENFLDIFRVFWGVWESLFLIFKYKPDIVLSAGAFVSVPLAYAAWAWRVPIIIHQQDARPGLANKLMAPVARVVTVAFEKSLKDYGKRAVWVGNPVRESLKLDISPGEARGRLGLKKDMPTCLIMGGGTGALALNKLVLESLNEITCFCQIIHITGKGKMFNLEKHNNYYVFEFLRERELALAYSSADLVISRCGMGALTELSFLAKPTILIPMPDSHQEDNARIFAKARATIVLDQKTLNSQEFVLNIKKILKNKKLRQDLSHNISKVIKRGSSNEIAKIACSILKNRVK